MKAVILSAGLGGRLRPITLTMPKPMVTVGHKPILEHLVDLLTSRGINQILVNLHYMPEKIMEYFGPRLLYSFEPELLGEEGTLKSLRDWLEDDWFIVMNGDTLTNINPLELYRPDSQDIRWMDGEVYAGTRMCGPDYFRLRQNHKFTRHKSTAYWLDIGTPERLAAAREKFKK